jgi:hypothetical protein
MKAEKGGSKTSSDGETMEVISRGRKKKKKKKKKEEEEAIAAILLLLLLLFSSSSSSLAFPGLMDRW